MTAGERADAVAQARVSRPFAVTHRDVLRITLPMTLAFLTTPLLGLTDIAVAGRLGEPAALAGLVVGALIFDFAFSTFNFIRSGTTGLTAQAFGAEDGMEMQAVFWRAVILALGIGAALILLEPVISVLGLLAIAPDAEVAAATRTYLFWRMFSAPFALLNYALLGYVLGRGQGSLGLVLQLVINGVNIGLSILFGYVLGGGIAGIALGTVSGEAIGAAIGLVVVMRGFPAGERPGRRRILDRAGFLRMIALNRDIMIRSFCLLGGYMLFTRLGASLGALTLAVNGVLLNLFMIGGYFLDGVATASEQLVGRAVGAFWRPAFDRAVKLTTLWALGLSGLLTLVFLLGGNGFVDLLTTDAAIRETARPYVGWAAVSVLAGALAFVMDGIYIGATWSRAMRDMMILSVVLFAVLAYALVPVLGNHGLWLAFNLFLSLRGATLLAALPSRRRRTFGCFGAA
ncbi:MATE family efflux transporter [Aureimonas sp. SA4125]|uniref:MATE family efflux transporter n=1 Tax=Aureimonas sp. SA4125 TaxID=2826993 RepID=UPI001CC4824E|nr:MATE family efflux transporter [Aureimonas sp. SA4125]BDA83406.1 MATE family efflux transporter [Aureimonas sp. SA4125]